MSLVVLALIVDGTMSYDIFDSRPETIKMWIVLALIVIIGLIIVVADSSKIDNNQDRSRLRAEERPDEKSIAVPQAGLRQTR